MHRCLAIGRVPTEHHELKGRAAPCGGMHGAAMVPPLYMYRCKTGCPLPQPAVAGLLGARMPRPAVDHNDGISKLCYMYRQWRWWRVVLPRARLLAGGTCGAQHAVCTCNSLNALIHTSVQAATPPQQHTLVSSSCWISWRVWVAHWADSAQASARRAEGRPGTAGAMAGCWHHRGNAS